MDAIATDASLDSGELERDVSVIGTFTPSTKPAAVALKKYSIIFVNFIAKKNS